MGYYLPQYPNDTFCHLRRNAHLCDGIFSLLFLSFLGGGFTELHIKVSQKSLPAVRDALFFGFWDVSGFVRKKHKGILLRLIQTMN